jgi:hypothetical protein
MCVFRHSDSRPLSDRTNEVEKVAGGESHSCEANTCSADQEIVCILLKPKVRYHVHKSPQQVSIIGQMNSRHIFAVCLFKTNLTILFFHSCLASELFSPPP